MCLPALLLISMSLIHESFHQVKEASAKVLYPLYRQLQELQWWLKTPESTTTTAS